MSNLGSIEWKMEMLCRNELKQRTCLWKHREDDNRKVTIMESLKNIMEKVY